MGFTSLALIGTVLVSAQRMPTVTCDFSGESGNWTLDFTVTNNFQIGEGNLYFFGVYLPSGNDVLASPGNWNPNAWTAWSNLPFGGSPLVYNNNWLDSSNATTIAPGASLGGFQARLTTEGVPIAVQWFAYASGGVYLGNDNFNNEDFPGFEGIINVVPEPASMAALGLGVAALLRRRRR